MISIVFYKVNKKMRPCDDIYFFQDVKDKDVFITATLFLLTVTVIVSIFVGLSYSNQIDWSIENGTDFPGSQKQKNIM